jgi:DNA-binding LacI/PurR family transcriptional regulator
VSSSTLIKVKAPVSKARKKAQLVEDLTSEMSWLLSQPPTCVGAKLQPEEDLANSLGLPRRLVREAITFFTDKGVLVRRQGSGTYVRRIHSHPADCNESKTFGLTHELLFQNVHTHNQQTAELRQELVGKSTQSLRIGLWTEWQLSPPNSTTHLILSMFMRHAQLAGHTLTIHSQVVSSQVALPVDEMARQLEHATDDGFLVGSQYADTFLKARELSGSTCPYLFHIMGSGDFDLHPSIFVDTENACQNALLKLVNLGYQRIGTIAMNKATECDIEHHIHRAVMLRAEFPDCQRFCTYSYDMGVASAMSATRQLLDKAGGKLDAIYVANDMVLVGVNEALNLAGIVPGKDIAIITLANRGYPLPAGYDWSVMEFDPESFASASIRQLSHHIEYPQFPPASLSIHATWKPGTTHLIARS